MNKAHGKAIVAVIIITFLIFLELVFIFLQKKFALREQQIVDENSKMFRATLLAFGDINLGRSVGQRILNGEVNFPFEKINARKDSADIVFANLESQLSNQNGKTVDSNNNLVFTGPPQGAKSLSNAGITVVSTANNHALDFGVKALYETIDNLHRENIYHVGTSKQKEKLFHPLIIEKNNIKFAIFGVTAFVNFTPKDWRSVIASADTVTLLAQFARFRDSVDFIVVSYHGGTEYTDKPVNKTTLFTKWCIKNGVDLVLGHHPHVTHGIHTVNGSIIVHSLGNFVFNQPQHYWTQRSYGIKFCFEKNKTGKRLGIEKIIPLKIVRQTERLIDSIESQKLLARTKKLSNIDLSLYWK